MSKTLSKERAAWLRGAGIDDHLSSLLCNANHRLGECTFVVDLSTSGNNLQCLLSFSLLSSFPAILKINGEELLKVTDDGAFIKYANSSHASP